MLRVLLKAFQQPPVKSLVEQQLEDAQVALLDAENELERADATHKMLLSRVHRLSTFLEAIEKEQQP